MCFVKNMQPKKMLFVVHRQKIAKKSLETFKKIIPSEEGIAFGMYSGDTMDSHADYLFSTVQTISRDKHLQKFSKNHFDYIIVDETHRAGAESYEKILKYFSPKFLLGMTATPERMDGRDVAKLFDHNIACEIRLRTAMEYEIVCPFHYFGIDVTVEDQIIEEAAFNLLSSEERVKRIIEKIDEYGVDDGIIRGLVLFEN